MSIHPIRVILTGAAAMVGEGVLHELFCYVSGAGTDASEKSGMHWARVKGKTENDLQKLPFRQVYLFRPGILKPTPGLRNTLKYYKWLDCLLR
jgi:hypothetical protein